MNQLPISDANGDAEVENGMADEKQPLNNGVADRLQIVENVDCTDRGHVPRAEMGDYNKRKLKAKNNGKRYRINFIPIAERSIRLEERIKKKTGLSRMGLILLFLSVLLTIVIIICIFLLVKQSHSTSSSVCVTPSCLRSSLEILPKLDLNVAPCSDFRQYACGNWFSTNPLPKDRSVWNMKELLQFKYRQKAHEALSTKTISTFVETSYLWKIKNFYVSCMNVDDRTAADEHLKKEINKSFGGWEVTDTFRSQLSWDPHKVLSQFYSRNLVSPFFRIEVVPDPSNTKQNIILLKPPVLGLSDVSYYSLNLKSPEISAYTQYVKDIAQIFGATSVNAEVFSEDLYAFEQRIAESLVARSGNYSLPLYTKMKIKELMQILHPIKVNEILFGNLPRANINQETQLLISNMEYFKQLPNIVSMSSKVSLNKYLMWCLLAEYVPYLSEKYVATLHMFKKQLNGQYEPVPRWEFCMETLERFAGFGLLSMYENELSKEEKDKTESIVSQIFSETWSAVKKSVTQIKHSEIQKNIIDKMTVSIQTGLPANMLQPKYIDEYYNNFITLENDFLQNIFNGISFIQDTNQRKLKEHRPEDNWLDDMISSTTTISYNTATNYIVVPSSLLQRPYFEREYPLMSRYGGVGIEMAKALISNVIPNHSEEERDQYLSAISECILGKTFSELDIPDRTSFVTTLVGLKYSFKSLKTELSIIEDSHQPALEKFSSEQLFFIYYVQSICSVKTESKGSNENRFSKLLNDTVLSNTLLAELPEFSEQFSCNSNSKYSSSLCTM